MTRSRGTTQGLATQLRCMTGRFSMKQSQFCGDEKKCYHVLHERSRSHTGSDK